MRNKKFLKFVANLLNKPIVRLAFYLGGIFLVLGLSRAFSDRETMMNTFLEIVTSQDMLTLLLAGLLSLGVVKILNWFDSYMEESMKIEDDHHKIITQYKGYEVGEKSYRESFANKRGVFLAVHHLREKMEKPKKPTENATKMEQKAYKKQLHEWNKALSSRNSVKDEESGDYILHEKMAERYLSGELCLSAINVFANISGDTKIKFDDSAKKHELPSFVIAHADEILQAHKNSAKNNSSTVRLDDFEYDQQSKTLVLKTSRSTYYHMLITNRCMDYKFANGMSIRELYEYEDEICPLHRSKLGNQIGINGLIVTNDNYILVEKRGRKKITWKNKFAQSISLALKLKGLNLERKGVMDGEIATAEAKIKHIIEKTINDNFGLKVSEYEEFKITENFLGLARDLLEGGKPNLYFYVKTNCNAKELKQKLEQNIKVVRADNEGKPKAEQLKVISSSKLDSEYYLIPFSDVEIDYSYRMFVDKRNAYRVNRKLYPRCEKRVELWDKAKNKVARIFNPVLVRECGEALLTTLAYMELRQEWVNSQQGKKKTDE